MPVDLDTHDPAIDLTPGTTKSDIVAFLYNNSNYGYKPAEISEYLNIPHGTTTTTLKRLHETGCLGKTDDSYYHTLDRREDLSRYVAGLDQLDRMFSHPPDEDRPPTPDEEDASRERIDDTEVEAELADLEADLEQ